MELVKGKTLAELLPKKGFLIMQGKLILSRDERERVEFATRAVARYLDTAHLRKVQHQYLRERV